MKLIALIVLGFASAALLGASDYWLGDHAKIPREYRLGPPVPRTAAQIEKIVDKLDGEKRHSYVIFLWTFDLAGPLVYGAFLYVAISLGAWPGLRWIAVAAAVTDYIENVLTTVLLRGTESSLPATLCALATPAKWALYGSAAAIAVIAYIALKVGRA